MDEDELLNRVAVEQLLAPLEEADRVMMLMIWRISYPMDYFGPLPATLTDIGDYIGQKFEATTLSEAAIRYRKDITVAALRGERPFLRRTQRKNPLKSLELRSERLTSDVTKRRDRDKS